MHAYSLERIRSCVVTTELWCCASRAGKGRFVKFHFTPVLGTHSLVWDECVKIAGKDADFHRRDLWEAIEKGAYPEWEFGVQIVSGAMAGLTVILCR